MKAANKNKPTKIRNALELHESRVAGIELVNGVATIYFSHAYIHKPKGERPGDKATGWSQKAELVMVNAIMLAPLPTLPNIIFEGFLEIKAIKHTLVPLPFKRKGDVGLCLFFKDGGRLEIAGKEPSIELLGKPIYLNDFA